MGSVASQVLQGLLVKEDAASVESDNSPEVDMARWLHGGDLSTKISAGCEQF